MKNVRAGAVVAFAVLAGIVAAQTSGPRPNFGDYKVGAIYKGAIAPVVIPQRWRRYRTMIREGANSGPQFAGHYRIAQWGCGSGCSMFVIVDSESGKIFDGPGETVAELPGDWWRYAAPEDEKKDWPERIESHPDSRLLKINGCLNEEKCGFYDYQMIDGQGLKLIRKLTIPER